MMNIKLIDGWRNLWKSWTMQLGLLGAVAPDLLQLLADNSSLIPWFEDSYKSGIRLACLILILFLRPVKQASLTKDVP